MNKLWHFLYRNIGYLFTYLFLAVFIVILELIILIFLKLFHINFTGGDFLVTFVWSYGIMFFAFSLIFINEVDKKYQEEKKNPFGVYHKR